MARSFLFVVFLSFFSLAALGQQGPEKQSQEARLSLAKKLAQEIILVDGHVDLPYRMKVGGFTLQREVLDVSVRTPDGNFDYPRARG